tara:strand:+ start:1553 stop:1918 length:366 start_codon:yes stop_codon:yes gene_type:complete
MKTPKPLSKEEHIATMKEIKRLVEKLHCGEDMPFVVFSARKEALAEAEKEDVNFGVVASANSNVDFDEDPDELTLEEIALVSAVISVAEVFVEEGAAFFARARKQLLLVGEGDPGTPVKIH